MNNQNMKPVISILLIALMVVSVASCAPAGEINVSDHEKSRAELRQEFEKIDQNGDGYLSLEEFQALNKDDLAFKAADLNDDGRLDLIEFIRYSEAKAADRRLQQQK